MDQYQNNTAEAECFKDYDECWKFRCSNCHKILRPDHYLQPTRDKFCPECGRKIIWKSYRDDKE